MAKPQAPAQPAAPATASAPAGKESKIKSQLDNVRARTEQALEKAEAEYRNQLLKRRIELASQGAKAYQEGKMSEAVQCFLSYLRILEQWKGVPEGGLTPDLFDRKRDLAELLLICGMYWDLAKLFDKAKTKQKKREFANYLNKYILFSKGMPYQALCAETLRKYIVASKAVHAGDFKDAFKLIGNEKCFVATALLEHTAVDTIPTLRDFRDEVLMHSFAGRIFVGAYYIVGPLLARATDLFPESVRRRLGRVIDGIAGRIDLSESPGRYDPF